MNTVPANTFYKKNGVLLYKSHWSVKSRKKPKWYHDILSNIRCTTNRVRGDCHRTSPWHNDHYIVKNKEEYYFWTGRSFDESCYEFDDKQEECAQW